jgi:hypothetical protein
MSLPLQTVKANDWLTVNRNFSKIKTTLLGDGSSPIFEGLTLTGLTATRLTATDGDKTLSSVADLTSWIAGTTDQITVTDDSDGTVTLSTPQDIHTGAIPTFAGMILNGTTAIGLDMSGGTFATAIQKWPAGTIQSTGDIVFQPTGDSTTAYQWKDSGGTVFIRVDSTNKRVRFGANLAPQVPLHIFQTADNSGLRISGFDDKSGNEIDIEVDQFGRGRINVDMGMVFSASGGNLDFGTNAGEIFFRTASDIFFDLKEAVSSFFIRSNLGANITFHHSQAGFTTLGSSDFAETLLELTHATPIIQQQVSTHTNALDARKSIWRAKGNKTDETKHTLGQFSFSHDTAADDYNARWVLSLNITSGTADTLVDALKIDSNLLATFSGEIENPKSKRTLLGGWAVKLTNTTGANTVQGQTVKADPTTDDAVILTAAGDTECIGVFLDSGIADDAEAWVVVSGIADVAMEDDTAATHGNWVETSDTEAGYANAESTTPAASPAHFEEIGHCVESVAAGGGGTHILARCVLHFN